MATTNRDFVKLMVGVCVEEKGREGRRSDDPLRMAGGEKKRGCGS